MHLLILQISLICTSALAWITISSSCCVQIPYYKRINTLALTIPILTTLWVTTTYDCHKIIFLCQGISLMPSFNCWSSTLLIPFTYLYYNFRITSLLPDKQQWLHHLLLPGILAAVYAGLSLISPSDQRVYSWNELTRDLPVWWLIFRVSCYLASIIQLSVYIFHLWKSMKINGIKAITIRNETIFVLWFCSISFCNILTTSYVLHILYDSSIAALGGYVMWRFRLYPKIKNKIRLRLPNTSPVKIMPRTKESANHLTEKQKRMIDKWLSPEVFKSKISLNDIANDVMIETSVLSAYLKQKYGASLSDIVKAHRLQYVEESLLNENFDTVTELSEEAGFQSSSNFYSTFKAKNKVSPLEWKKKISTKKEEEKLLNHQ